MKEFLTKIKLGLVALWVQLISFSSKALGDIIETFWDARQNEPKYEPMQAAYWVPNPTNHINPILNAIKWTLAVTILIIWILSLIRIIKTEDKDLKKKRIKNAIIIIAILSIILSVTFIISARLIKK